MNKDVLCGLNFLFCVIPSKSDFSHCDNLAGKADASTVSAKIQSWLGVKNHAVLNGLLLLAIRAVPLYFHQICLSSSVISQKIRLPVRLMPRLFRCKISFCSVAGSQRKKNSSLLNQLTDYINYYSMWVSAIPMVTARFLSLWMGYCDVCDLPGGRSVIWYLEACRKVYKLPN